MATTNLRYGTAMDDRRGGIAGARGLFYGRVAAFLWYVLSMALERVVFRPSTETDTLLKFVFATDVVWVLFDVVLLVTALPFWRGQKGKPTEPTALAYTVLVGVALGLGAISLGMNQPGASLAKLLGPEFTTAYSLVDRAVHVAMYLCLWLTLVRLAAPRNDWWTPAFYLVLAGSQLLGLLPLVLAREVWLELIAGPTGSFLPWVRIALSFALNGFVLVQLWRVAAENGDAPTTSAETTVLAEDSAGRDILYGALSLVLGCVITFVSYSAAASSPSGGRFLISVGPIVFGVIRLGRGLLRQGRG